MKDKYAPDSPDPSSEEFDDHDHDHDNDDHDDDDDNDHDNDDDDDDDHDAKENNDRVSYYFYIYLFTYSFNSRLFLNEQKESSSDDAQTTNGVEECGEGEGKDENGDGERRGFIRVRSLGKIISTLKKRKTSIEKEIRSIYRELDLLLKVFTLPFSHLFSCDCFGLMQ